MFNMYIYHWGGPPPRIKEKETYIRLESLSKGLLQYTFPFFSLEYHLFDRVW